MLTLALVLALGQVEPPPPMPLPEPEPPPESTYVPPAPTKPPPSPELRIGLGIGGGTLAGGAGLGIALLLTGQNSAFEPTFATAALSALLVAGVAFSIHQALGGNGEIILAFLGSAAMMGVAAGIAVAVDPGQPVGAILVAAAGSLPAAGAAVTLLELTTPNAKPKTGTVSFNLAPNGVYGTF
ncbi:MAG: hypothetical protein DI536_09635 [Archangium gephyra]|uniref:Uncharacterized protein n=1 Tax=Archangium gephyra TaxID=48 RepID=A0A2W5V0R2_9BACT|nr:MAG: hypothetical protein DI536_09635 [Archangium gephyra]